MCQVAMSTEQIARKKKKLNLESVGVGHILYTSVQLSMQLCSIHH